METEILGMVRPNDGELKRWFSTGFLAHGVGSVTADQHTLNDAALIRPGEARGHQMWIDGEMCRQVAAAGNERGDKGLKARFGHPDMCSDALGTFLGRWKALSVGEASVVRGTLFLSATAAESPKGDLRNYVESMAAKEPEHFGTSIVFSRDWIAEEDFIVANGGEFAFGRWGDMSFVKMGTAKTRKEIPEGMDYYVDTTNWKSPDPANTKNLRHARLSALHAADLVDDPAATDGMFSGATGTALAARVSEWLDTHPEILTAFAEQPEMLGIVERYAGQLRPFMDRYTANHSQAAAEPAAAKVPDTAATAESVAALTAERDALAAQLGETRKECERLTNELAAAADKAVQLAATVLALTERAVKAESERDEALAKLAALEKGAAPVSAAPAMKDGEKTPWQKAQRR
jgi:hypothetical protein